MSGISELFGGFSNTFLIPFGFQFLFASSSVFIKTSSHNFINFSFTSVSNSANSINSIKKLFKISNIFVKSGGSLLIRHLIFEAIVSKSSRSESVKLKFIEIESESVCL